MIGKLAAQRKGVTVERQVQDLVAYIDRETHSADRGEVLAREAVNLIADTRRAQAAEMAATATGAIRARTPIEHVILSWHEDEQPDIRQIREAVAIVMDEAGLSRHQALWTLHRAEHLHLHLVINRVAPDAKRPTKVMYWHNTLGRAVARIEHAQGWQREPGARFEVIGGNSYVERSADVARTATGYDRDRSLGSAGRTQGDEADHPAAQRGDGRDRSPGRDHRHARVDERQARRARGAAAGDSPATRIASRVDTAKLGLAQRTGSSAGARAQQDGAAERQVLHNLKIAGSDDPSARLARLVTEVQLRSAYRALPRGCAVAEAISRMDALSPEAAALEIRRGEMSAERIAIEVAGPIIARAGTWRELHAGLAAEGILYRTEGSGAVMEIGAAVVKASTCRKAALGALIKRLGAYEPRIGPVLERTVAPAPGIASALFAATQAGRIEAERTRAGFEKKYAALAFMPRLAAAVAGVDLRVAPDARTVAERTGVPKPTLAPIRGAAPPAHDPSSPLGRYHAAVQAERYRVIVRRPATDTDGERVFQIAPCSIDAVVAEAGRIQQLGSNGAAVSIVPCSERQHHIVVSGLDATGLDRLRSDGFSPAVVLEIGADQFEAVLATPRRDSQHDRAGAQAASRELNARYGDAAGTGLAAGHHCPGTWNWGAAGRGDERAPFVRIVAAAAGQCRALWDLILVYIEEFRVRAAEHHHAWTARGRERLGIYGCVPVYDAHRRDIVSELAGERRDNSRIDGLVAQRLRATGHGRDQIARIIETAAPLVDRCRRQDWRGYGGRAAAFAYSAKSDAFLERTQDLHVIWRQLEAEARARAKKEREDAEAATQPKHVTPPLPGSPEPDRTSPPPRTRPIKRDGHGR